MKVVKRYKRYAWDRWDRKSPEQRAELARRLALILPHRDHITEGVAVDGVAWVIERQGDHPTGSDVLQQDL